MKLTEAELMEHVRVRLETPRGEFIHDPDLGSELWRLKRAKNIATLRRDADRYIRQALQPEIDAGLMTSVEKIEVIELTQTGFKLYVVLRAGEERIACSYDGVAGRVIPDDVVGC